METATMGKVLVPATIENLEDLWEVKKGTRRPEDVRRVEVTDALVDTGAKMLSLPRRYIEQLGLEYFETRFAQTTGGRQPFDIYRLVQLTLMERQCPLDVAALSDDCPVLIGQIPLERLDFVVDPGNQRLIGNPDHGGEYVIDMF
jgi:predicted aspartyl protease